MTNIVPVHEGRPLGVIKKWVRLVIRANATADDQEAEELLREFAKALGSSDYSDEFTLSIFRIEAAKVPQFGILPKVENELACDGIAKVRRYLTQYTEDIKVPLVT